MRIDTGITGTCFLLSLLLGVGCSDYGNGLGGKHWSPAGSGLLNTTSSARTDRLITRKLAALNGGLVAEFGDDLSGQDMQTALRAEYRALESAAAGIPVKWQSAGNISGQVVPKQVYQVGSQSCRSYSHALSISGAIRMATGTACRDTDGSWSLLR